MNRHPAVPEALLRRLERGFEVPGGAEAFLATYSQLTSASLFGNPELCALARDPGLPDSARICVLQALSRVALDQGDASSLAALLVDLVRDPEPLLRAEAASLGGAHRLESLRAGIEALVDDDAAIRGSWEPDEDTVASVARKALLALSRPRGEA